MLSRLQDSHGGPSRLEPPALGGALCCCVTAASVPDGSSVTCTPADTCQNGAASARVGWSLSGEGVLSDYTSPITNLQWHRRL